MTLCRGLISSVYSPADGVHVGRTSVVAVSRGHLQARVGTVRPWHSVSLQASTLGAWLCFCIGTLVITKPIVHWVVGCSSRGRINNSLWGKVCLLLDPLAVHWDTLLIIVKNSTSFSVTLRETKTAYFDEAKSTLCTSCLDKDRMTYVFFPRTRKLISAAFPFWEVSSTFVTPLTLRHAVGPVTG